MPATVAAGAGAALIFVQQLLVNAAAVAADIHAAVARTTAAAAAVFPAASAIAAAAPATAAACAAVAAAPEEHDVALGAALRLHALKHRLAVVEHLGTTTDDKGRGHYGLTTLSTKWQSVRPGSERNVCAKAWQVLRSLLQLAAALSCCAR